MRRTFLAASLIAGAIACVAPMTVPTTGLTGTVVRGPIAPVCRVDTPCSAPFSAHFTVMSGSSTVATFLSDSSGVFTVMLAPGSYTIVPAASAPVMSATSQAKSVVVGPVGLTTVQLEFDTGIR
jgi:hypothetical protein